MLEKFKIFCKKFCKLIMVVLYFALGLLFSIVGIVIMIHKVAIDLGMFAVGMFFTLAGIGFFYCIAKEI